MGTSYLAPVAPIGFYYRSATALKKVQPSLSCPEIKYPKQQISLFEDVINYLHDEYHQADAIEVLPVIRTEYAHYLSL